MQECPKYVSALPTSVLLACFLRRVIGGPENKPKDTPETLVSYREYLNTVDGAWFTALFLSAILIGLGTWQMQRLALKQGLLADISQRAHGEPVDITHAERSKRAGEDVEYLRVKTVGQFLHGSSRRCRTS